MRFRAGGAILIVLTLAPACWANVPVVVYRDDPGYERARVASRVAPVIVPAFLGVAVLWAAFDRSRSGRAAAIGFGAAVLIAGAVLFLGSGGSRFPDESPGAGTAEGPFARRRGSPRETTPEETVLGGLVASALLCFGGLTLARAVTRRGGEGERPTGPDRGIASR